MHPEPEAVTPADFPRDTEMGAVAGVQPKIAVRKIDGKFVTGLTEEELYSRYTVSHDMLNQLVDLCQSELDERKNVDVGELFREVKEGVAGKRDWGFTEAERHWLMVQLCARMGWPSPK
jgi:hypothetical protein